ncbi:MAG: hypothetical protein RSC99_05325 [Clostridiales bacterium]
MKRSWYRVRVNFGAVKGIELSWHKKIVNYILPNCLKPSLGRTNVNFGVLNGMELSWHKKIVNYILLDGMELSWHKKIVDYILPNYLKRSLGRVRVTCPNLNGYGWLI